VSKSHIWAFASFDFVILLPDQEPDTFLKIPLVLPSIEPSLFADEFPCPINLCATARVGSYLTVWWYFSQPLMMLDTFAMRLAQCIVRISQRIYFDCFIVLAGREFWNLPSGRTMNFQPKSQTLPYSALTLFGYFTFSPLIFGNSSMAVLEYLRHQESFQDECSHQHI